MKKVTLDTNILIDLEEKRKGYKTILKIIELHNKKKLKINIPAIIASEKLLEDKHITNFHQFKDYLKTLGFKDVELTLPIFYVGMCYVNFCVVPGEDEIKLDHDIHKILFPNIESEYREFCANRKFNPETIHPKWRRTKVDVQILWCHIFYKKDVLVTRDKNFKRHIDELSSIAKLVIMKPEEFLSTQQSNQENCNQIELDNGICRT
ncbi:MAG: hypothetical protein H8E54_05310 [Candidatus Aminicenantes bacterium]|nr:hypothetical protein [Candidatus Aminicenantes bacterium]